MRQNINQTKMYQKRIFAPDTIYHVYNRGNKKDILFYDDEDFHFYLRSLTKYAVETGFDLLCYCLMDNHYHFCCQQKSETSLSKLALKLNTSYAMYFNKKYKQVGHIFQGRYKYKIVNSDRYLSYLSMYIHSNPLDKDTMPMDEYPYSSYREYTEGHENLCKHQQVLKIFDNSYLEYYIYSLQFKDSRNKHQKPYKQAWNEPATQEDYPDPKPKPTDLYEIDFWGCQVRA